MAEVGYPGTELPPLAPCIDQSLADEERICPARGVGAGNGHTTDAVAVAAQTQADEGAGADDGTLAAGKRSWHTEKRFGFRPWWPGAGTIASSRGRNKMQEQGRRNCDVIQGRIRPANAAPQQQIAPLSRRHDIRVKVMRQRAEHGWCN